MVPGQSWLRYATAKDAFFLNLRYFYENLLIRQQNVPYPEKIFRVKKLQWAPKSFRGRQNKEEFFLFSFLGCQKTGAKWLGH